MLPKIVAIITIKLSFWGFIGQQVLAQVTNPTTVKPATIKVKQINIEGNTVFSDSELETIVAPLEGTEVTTEQIFEVRDRLGDYYESNGYDNSGAFIAPQKVQDGNITIKIIEGTLIAIEITGLRYLDDDYIKSRLPQIEKPLNRKELANSLAKLQKNPLIKSLHGEIKTQSVGKTILLLDIKENPPLTASLTLTDTYSPNIGRFGGNTTISYHNLLGSGDELNVNGALTDGLWRIGSSYSFLINKYDGKIIFEYNTANIENVESEIKALGVEADYEAFQLKFSQPLIFTPTEKLTVGLGIERIRSETFVLEDISFAFVRGLPDGESKITNLQFFQEYIGEGATTLLSINSQFNVGVDLFDATRTEAGIDGIAWFWQGQAQHFKRLDQKTILFNRFGIQLTPNQLLPLQQAGERKKVWEEGDIS